MRLKITSTDLLPEHTRVMNAETGEELEGVTKVSINIDAANGRGTAVITVLFTDIDVTSDVEIVNETIREPATQL